MKKIENTKNLDEIFVILTEVTANVAFTISGAVMTTTGVGAIVGGTTVLVTHIFVKSIYMIANASFNVNILSINLY